MIECLEATLARIESRLNDLVEAETRLDGQLECVEDGLLVLQFEHRGPGLPSTIARRLRPIDRTRLADLLDDAVDEGRLSLEERDNIMLADAVFRGRRFEDDAEVYVLAEVSVGIGPHDVERASERAALLEKLGRPVIPVVGGRRIDSETLALAGERGVWQSLEGRATPPITS